MSADVDLEHSENEGIYATAVAGWTFFGAILTFAIVIALQAVFFDKVDELDASLNKAAHRELAALRTKDKTRLNQYRWVDQEAQRVAIPISLAMAKVAQELRSEVPTDNQGGAASEQTPRAPGGDAAVGDSQGQPSGEAAPAPKAEQVELPAGEDAPQAQPLPKEEQQAPAPNEAGEPESETGGEQ